MNRRQFLVGAGSLGLSGLAVAGWRFWPDQGWTNPCLSGLDASIQTHPLMQKVWADIDPQWVWDSHVHLVGVGDSPSGIWFNPDMDSLWHPILKTQKYFYMNGLCAVPGQVDTSAVARMVQLHSEMPKGVKSMLFAFDWFHNEQGEPSKAHSIFHIPNDYAARIAQQHADYFEWVASIHPYRADALDALDQVKAQGARAIKWLPSGMGIDPASPRCDRFYQKAAALGLPIISHTGRESAVQGGDQAHGNPLRMRRALDQGVTVVLAHCASDGVDEDLDHAGREVKSIELFARLMDTPEYKTNLYGEISALTLINHAWALPLLLERTDWHPRLLNGSDYPLPGIFPLINVTALSRMALIASEHVEFLQTLKQHNPLLFDLAVKRLLRWKGVSFAPSVFETRRVFEAGHA